MIIISRYVRAMLAGCALLGVLVLAAPASAQDQGSAAASVTEDQYGDSADRFAAGGDDPADSASNVGSLPFTGLDLGVMGAAAVTLLAAGLVSRRRAGERENAAG